MTKHHRFTGRELSSLLEQVREELGTEATILEANKIRTGGVAGFFKTEKFEVVAAGPDDLAPTADGPTNLQLDLVDPDGRPAPSFSTPPQTIDDAPRIDLRTAIDDVRAERFHDVPDTVDIRTPLPSTVAGPSPMNPNPPPPTPPAQPTQPLTAPAMAKTARATAATARATAAPTAESIPSYFDTPHPDIDLSRGGNGATVVLDRPETEQASSRPFGDVLADELRQPDISIRSTETDSFWDTLYEVRGSLVTPDIDSRLITVVGNRMSALGMARRIQQQSTAKPALAALSPYPDELGLPAWQLIDTTIELVDRLQYWARADRAAVVIIDADLGEDALPMVDRLREAGSNLLRLTVDDDLPAERLHSLIEQLGGRVVVDLTFRPPPSYVCTLFDAGIPLGSVNGHDLDAGLLLAIRQAAANG